MNLRSETESTEIGSKYSGYFFEIILLKSRHYNKRDMLGENKTAKKGMESFFLTRGNLKRDRIFVLVPFLYHI